MRKLIKFIIKKYISYKNINLFLYYLIIIKIFKIYLNYYLTYFIIILYLLTFIF